MRTTVSASSTGFVWGKRIRKKKTLLADFGCVTVNCSIFVACNMKNLLPYLNHLFALGMKMVQLFCCLDYRETAGHPGSSFQWRERLYWRIGSYVYKCWWLPKRSRHPTYRPHTNFRSQLEKTVSFNSVGAICLGDALWHFSVSFSRQITVHLMLFPGDYNTG